MLTASTSLPVTLHPETFTQGAAGSNIKLIFKSSDKLIMCNYSSCYLCLFDMTLIGNSGQMLALFCPIGSGYDLS